MPADAKPSDRRQRRREAGQDAPTTDLALLPPVPAEIPKPPPGLLKVTKDAWDAFWDDEMARLINPRTDLPALHRLFTLRDEWERSRRAATEERFVEGSTGQMRLNPAIADMRIIEKEIRALEDRFGGTPSARMKLGAQFGDTTRSLAALNRQFNDEHPSDSDPRIAAIPESSQDE